MLGHLAMATIEHEALVDLFRRHPALVATLLTNVFATPLPAYDHATVIDASLDQLAPTQLRADLVIELRDADDRPVLVIVLEVQRWPKPEKRFSWPLYVAAARAKSQCPAILVVVAPDAAVARWAATPIDLGHGRMTLSPMVFGPNEVPQLDEETARENLELAPLSVIVHGDEDSALVSARGAVSALADLTSGQSDYLYVIMKALRPALREALRKWIMGKDETKEHYIAKFRPLLGEIAELLEAEGRAEGIAAGRAEGMAEGRVEGEAHALIRVLAARGLTMTDAQRERIIACKDVATLDRWLERAVSAASIDDVLR
jgi:hypothetical protein